MAKNHYDNLLILKRSFCCKPKLDEHMKKLLDCLIVNDKGSSIITTISDLASCGEIAKPEVLLTALAVCVNHDSLKSRQPVYDVVLKICHTPSLLFKFLTLEAEFSPPERKGKGFGRSKRRLISKWYNEEVPNARQLAVLMTKYKKRSGWSHKDVLRLSHVRPGNPAKGLLFKYALKGIDAVNENEFQDETSKVEVLEVLDYLKDIETVRHSTDEQQVVELINKHDLLQEHVPTWLKKSPSVWKALLQKMPIMATIRNLNKLTTVGLLNMEEPNDCVELVEKRLANTEHLKQARVHPFTILIAMKTYENGESTKGSHLTWKPNPKIIKALNNAFNLSFGVIKSTNKKYLLAIDGSESMIMGGVMDSANVTPLLASAAMAMALSHSEPLSKIVIISNQVIPVTVKPDTTLDDVHKLLSKECTTSSYSDCSLPMTWALNKEERIDVFVIYTCQAGQGEKISPVEAFHQYRSKMNHPQSRLVIVTLTSDVTSLDLTDFDAGMIHLSGFNASIHEVIYSFVMGRLDSIPGG